MKKVETNVAIFKNVSEKLVNRLIETERQCWANTHYSRQECLKVVGIPTSIPNELLEANISKVFDKMVFMWKGERHSGMSSLKR